jgi:hypothetical protein
MKYISPESGTANPLLISSIILAVLSAALGSVMVWALINYNDQKMNVDSKIDVAVTDAKKAQSDEDDKKFLEREKAPYVQYVGPEDLGRVTFNYPKTWSVYNGFDPRSGELSVYMHPGIVPYVTDGQQFAVELKVVRRSYEQTLKSYESLVKKGDLRSAPIVVNGFSGVRLDGKFSKVIEGSMVIFKVRDKTLTVATDANTFKPDFDGIILKSLDFNP